MQNPAEQGTNDSCRIKLSRFQRYGAMLTHGHHRAARFCGIGKAAGAGRTVVRPGGDVSLPHLVHRSKVDFPGPCYAMVRKIPKSYCVLRCYAASLTLSPTRRARRSSMSTRITTQEGSNSK